MRFGNVFPSMDLGVFSFQLLINGKEMFDFPKDVGSEILMAADLGVDRTRLRYREYFLVRHALIQRYSRKAVAAFSKDLSH